MTPSTSAPNVIRVLLVDDHPLFRDGLAGLLNVQEGIAVVGAAASATEALDMFRTSKPDVVITDYKLPDATGVEVAQRVLAIDSKAKIAVISNYQGDQDVRRALDAGCLCYLFKSSAREDVVSAIRSISKGRRFLPGPVAACLLEAEGALSARENEVLRLVARGFRNKEVAGELKISEATVKEHLRNVMGKLGATDRTEAVTIALKRGILHLA